MRRRLAVLTGAAVSGAVLGGAAATAVVPTSSGPPSPVRFADRDYRYSADLGTVDPDFHPASRIEEGQVFAPAPIVGAVPTVIDLRTDDGHVVQYVLVGGP